MKLAARCILCVCCSRCSAPQAVTILDDPTIRRISCPAAAAVAWHSAQRRSVSACTHASCPARNAQSSAECPPPSARSPPVAPLARSAVTMRAWPRALADMSGVAPRQC